MEPITEVAAAIASRLLERGETIAVAESSSGGLISASLLAVPGASAFYLGGAVIYTRQARRALLGISDDDMTGLRPATEAYARLLANAVREHHGASWGLAETGATGPTGNRYGDPAGHACIAATGPSERVLTIGTGSSSREANMREFAEQALRLLAAALKS